MRTRPNLLLVTHRVPYPPNRGDRIRTYHVLRFLARRANVHLACLADEPVTTDTAAHLRSLCSTVTIEPHRRGPSRLRAALSLAAGGTASEGAYGVRGLRTRLRQLARDVDFDGMLVSSSALAQYAEVPELRSVPLVVDLIDVDSQKWLDYAAASRGPKRLLYGIEGRRLRRVESRLADRAERLLVVSEAEADLYRSFRPDGPIHSITNGVDLETFAPAPEIGNDGLVFVGAMDYRPNVDGVVWFCQHVWPLLRSRRPEAVFRIVGREPTAAVRALASLPGVEVTGSVDDVRPYVARASAVVVPLHIARGVQNKLLEAMAMEKAIVSTPGPLQGLDVVAGRHLETASTPAEWVERLDALLGDVRRRESLGIEAGRWVRARHSWDACLQPLEELLPFRREDSATRTPRTPVPTGGRA